MELMNEKNLKLTLNRPNEERQNPGKSSPSSCPMKHEEIVQIAVARRNATTVRNDAQEMFNSWIVDVEMEDQEVNLVVVKSIFRKRNPKHEKMKKNKPGTSKGASNETQKTKWKDEAEDLDEINALSHLSKLALGETS